jgi:hypothetical protein
MQPAFRRAQMMMGVALELSSGQKVDASPDMQKAIDDEAQRVIAATGQSKPAWLGPPDPGFIAIDYTRFKPRGVYAERPALERYFRATAWLQAIPFRADKDDEFAAWLMLYEGLDDYDNKPLYNAEQEINNSEHGMANSLKSALEMFVGEPDNTDLFGSGHNGVSTEGWNAQFLAGLREQWAKSGPDEDDRQEHPDEVNDQVAVASKNGKPEKSYRILSAYRLPDTVMFTDTEKFHAGAFPSGREVAAALGSPTARDFYASGDAKLLAQIDKDKNLLAEGTLYNDYLNAMATLFEPVDASAPDLFRSPAWQEKSLQTFLGGWAQDRHAWMLQAKQNVIMLGDSEKVPSGFVEPVPDFFNRMAQLALKSHGIFHDAGAFDNGIHETTQMIRDGAAAYRRWLAARAKDPNAKLSTSDTDVIENGMELMVHSGDMAGNKDEDMPGEMEKFANQLENSGKDVNPDIQQALKYLGYMPEEKWTRFASLCLRLEELANKQLHHVPLTDEDNWFYADFGKTLGSFMGYDSNDFDSAHDDAPRIADIYSDPNTGQVLEVGVGRPLVMYLLYPYEGKLILTHGAVMPYYEFPYGERLTDEGWADLLTKPSAPEAPAWLGDVSARPVPEPKAAER